MALQRARFAALVLLISLTGCAPSAIAVAVDGRSRAAAPARASEEEDFGRRSITIPPEVAALIDRLGQRAAEELGVPGAALAIVHRGRVVVERSWGERSPGLGAVTPQTLFLLGSITKPMTTMMEAVLVDQGRLSWLSPLHTLLPDFAGGDALHTRQLLFWQASCACSGIPGYDMVNLFTYAGVSAQERVRTMRQVRPTASIGALYQYSNLMMAVGGYAAGHIYAPELELGEAYESAMRTLIFEPIGMNASTFDFDHVAAADHALPHALDIEGKVQVLPLSYERNVLPIRPAGGLWTTLEDMERYAITELSRGVAPSGKRVVSSQNLEERWERRIRAGEGDHGYGLGMGITRRHGLRVLSHSGGALGFGTTLVLLPDQELGVVILTNVRNGGAFEQLPFNEVLLQAALEVLFQARNPRAETRLTELVNAQREAVKAAQTAVVFTPDETWLRTISGRYHEANLGDVELRIEQGVGVFDAGEWKSRFGKRTSPSGTQSLVLLDPPFAGTSLALTVYEGKASFVVPEGDWHFRLERVLPMQRVATP